MNVLAPDASDSLAEEHALLQREYARVQARCSRLIAEQARAIGRLEAEAVRLRAAAVVRATALHWARQDQATLEAALPGLPKRRALALRVEALLARIQDLLWERLQRQKQVAAGEVAVPAAGQAVADMPPLADLEDSLVAADLVICQTGCLSHGDYWRVQDHCRRTGKACVLVDQPEALRIVRFDRAEAVAGRD